MRWGGKISHSDDSFVVKLACRAALDAAADRMRYGVLYNGGRMREVETHDY